MERTRRKFLQILISAAVSGSVFGLFRAGNARALPRPPASLVEDEFLKNCARCYQCIDVCPADALRPASFFDGIANLGTPVLDPAKCILCMECVRVCPTQAILKVPKEEVDIGTAVIDPDRCLALLKKKRCKACYKACKLDAIKLKKRRYPVVLGDQCTGCNVCTKRCPTDPPAIVVKYEKVKRYPAPAKHLAMHLENRVAPYEFPPDDFRTWFVKRLKKIAFNHGLKKE